MKTSFTDQIWIAIKIWFIAIAAYALMGTFYLLDSISKVYRSFDFLTVFAVLGAFFSFPVIVILLIIINRCIAAGTKGLWLFRIVLLSGVVLTIIAFIAFCVMHEVGNVETTPLLCFAVLSAIIAIASQYKPLLKAGSEFHQQSTSVYEN